MKKRTIIILVITLVGLVILLILSTQLRNRLLAVQAIERFTTFTGQSLSGKGSSDQIPEISSDTVTE